MFTEVKIKTTDAIVREDRRLILLAYNFGGYIRHIIVSLPHIDNGETEHESLFCTVDYKSQYTRPRKGTHASISQLHSLLFSTL